MRRLVDGKLRGGPSTAGSTARGRKRRGAPVTARGRPGRLQMGWSRREWAPCAKNRAEDGCGSRIWSSRGG